MTTNQTIDGLPREQMISFPRELSDELGDLIAEKARVCGGGAFGIWEAICEQFGKVEQPAPVAVVPENALRLLAEASGVLQAFATQNQTARFVEVEIREYLDEVTRLNTKE